MPDNEPVSLTEIVATLTDLHAAKDRIYLDAWQRRGELIGIFANIARKYDRLENAADETGPDNVESRADTAADLAIYAAKYLSWLIEHDSSLAAAFDADPNEWTAARGHHAVEAILADLERAEQRGALQPPATLDAAFVAVAEPFRELDEHLVAGTPLEPARKAELVWQLTDGAIRYLWRLAHDQPAAWGGFAAKVGDLA
jgi:hypothetical protein